MLKQLGILIVLLTAAFATIASSLVDDVPINYFGDLYYINQEQEMSLTDIRQLNDGAWEKTTVNNTSFGFVNDPYWFKVNLQNISTTNAPWFLRSDYPLLDTLDLYLFSNQQLIQEFHTGDKFPFKQRPIEHPSFVFPLNINAEREYTVYIHVKTGSSLQLPLSLEPENIFWKNSIVDYSLSAAFYAVLLSMLIYNAVIFLIVRERSYLYYSLYLGSFTLLMASLHGWAYQYLWPNSPQFHELSVVVLIGICIYFASFFTLHFLRLKDIRPGLDKLIKIFASVSLLCSLVSPFFSYEVMIRINASLTVLAALIAILATVQEWFRSHNRETTLFIIAWTTLLFGFLLYSGQKFGLLPVNSLTEHAIEIGAILEALLLALGLADKINSERKERLRTQERMLEIQIKANQELDNKVRERTEELEEINNHLQYASITDSLTQVKNRHYFDQKLVSEYRKAYREKHWLSLLIMDIDHFKAFNDNYGHQAGDKVLQTVASEITDVVKRPSDAVTRYGGEEFTVLLPNTPKEGAYLVAERIRKRIEETKINWEGTELSVTISIGLAACIPSSYKGEKNLLKQADDFLYLAKDKGRNQVIYKDNASN